MPRYIIGAVSMKISSSTSTTSTSGMMLISASVAPIGRPPPPPAPPPKAPLGPPPPRRAPPPPPRPRPRQPLLLALLAQRAGHFRQPPELLVARHVELGQGTLAELLGCRVHQCRPPPLARRPLKGRRLLPHLPELPPLLDDQRPAQDREHPEDHQDALGHRPRFGDQLHHCPARRVEHRRTPRWFSSTISDGFQRSQIFHWVSPNK